MILKKFKNTFLTLRYSSQKLVKFYKNRNLLLKILSKIFWFIPNNNQYNYWTNAEDIDHGYKKFIYMDDLSQKILDTVLNNSSTEDKILDICCNVGRVLNGLSLKGYKNLYGFDINSKAIEMSKNVFINLRFANLVVDTAENYLSKSKNNEFDITYSLGASLELIPSHFSLIYHISRITKKYHICLINENGHAYPRFWRYEFKKLFSSVEFFNYKKDRTLFLLKK
jgi:SAM-dependent methyltransferase